jgi:hypothetical protein
VASLTVVTGILGKRATAIYLGTIAVSAVFFGLVLDQVYTSMGISAQAMVGQASEVMPLWVQGAGALLVLILSIKPLYRMIISLRNRFRRTTATFSNTPVSAAAPDSENVLSSPGCGPT